ncbi:hypothetical protein KUCAC02_021476 [Chaenocephalus aceratus]|uniref:Uncharacterized protein n=1 Tax=Chaenocephalus aceratus TaxID=36190 RepID=A0ACB9XFN2_CHAAC|nr:hypothetical protein KUCAC02_021476 [Chaenocephalus aceratus]
MSSEPSESLSSALGCACRLPSRVTRWCEAVDSRWFGRELNPGLRADKSDQGVASSTPRQQTARQEKTVKEVLKDQCPDPEDTCRSCINLLQNSGSVEAYTLSRSNPFE